MKRCSSRLAVLGAVAIPLWATAPREAAAQIPVTDIAGNLQWIQQTLTQVKSLAQQVQSYQTQLQQYANMIQNTVALPQAIWANVQADIMQVRNLSNAAALLSGNTGTILTRLSSAGGYANQALSLANIGNQFTTWQQTIDNNVTTMGKVIGLQQDQQNNNSVMMAALAAQSQTAQGQMQAIQAGNELAHMNGNILLQMQSTLATTAQMQATAQAVQADRRASEDNAMLNFVNVPEPSSTGYRSY